MLVVIKLRARICHARKYKAATAETFHIRQPARIRRLKNGGTNLVDALHEVIQQAWTNEILPRSWTEGVLFPVYKKGGKLDYKNYRGICLLNVTYKVFANILYDRLLPHANPAVQHYQAGIQSGKSTTDQLFALRQI
jgi:hypothetical protein